MLSKKSKIERLRKSREDQFFVVSATASLCRACTKVCDRFCLIRCGPLTLPRVGRTSGAKTFRSLARKDFFDSISQTEKNSVRPNVFRFALELGHRVMMSALGICATSGRPSLAQCSPASPSIVDIKWLLRSC